MKNKKTVNPKKQKNPNFLKSQGFNHSGSGQTHYATKAPTLGCGLFLPFCLFIAINI